LEMDFCRLLRKQKSEPKVEVDRLSDLDVVSRKLQSALAELHALSREKADRLAAEARHPGASYWAGLAIEYQTQRDVARKERDRARAANNALIEAQRELTARHEPPKRESSTCQARSRLTAACDRLLNLADPRPAGARRDPSHAAFFAEHIENLCRAIITESKHGC
jgi:hypothetical protein